MKSQDVHRAMNLAYLIVFCLVISTLQAYSQSCNCPPVASCGACLGGFNEFTFRYNGPSAVTVAASDDSGYIYFNLFVNNGETFSVEGSLPLGRFQGNQLTLWVNGFLNYTFNTSCVTLINVNSNYGNFTVLAAESAFGGDLCCTS